MFEVHRSIYSNRTVMYLMGLSNNSNRAVIYKNLPSSSKYSMAAILPPDSLRLYIVYLVYVPCCDFTIQALWWLHYVWKWLFCVTLSRRCKFIDTFLRFSCLSMNIEGKRKKRKDENKHYGMVDIRIFIRTTVS